ncbi:MAG TPA: sulfatase-like hydrolase/transferase, partial [Planctomycetota bacterium]|nr:sulfatase-like hydrolase/transferase [Planctomycetota bacterium]
MMTRDSRPTPGRAIALTIPALLLWMAVFPHRALSLGAVAPAAEEKPVRPNIVFILADDLGYGDLGCYGQQRIRTPEIDRLAAEGLRFVQFYAGSTVCAPSRCVLMTGRHTGHATVRGNSRDTSLRENELTVARLLQGAGYTTACIGKWGLGDPGSAGVPRRQGFDYFFGYLNHVHAHNYYPSHLWRNEERVPLQNRVPGEGAQGQGVADRRVDYSADLIAEEALGFIRRSREQPFFLYFAPTIPHANNEAREKGMEVPHHGEYAALDWPEAQKGHAAMISRLDRSVGRILSLLEDLGLDERTIVLFSSDNGPHREGGADPRFNASSGPFRGLKRDLHEGGIRVPMIARWPGRIAAGKTSEHAGYFGDLLATAADLAGLPVPGGLDSLSFVPTLIGRGEQRRHDALYWEFHEGGFSQATLVEGRWKAVRKRRLDAPVEIYDLAADPAEAHDVAAQNAGRVAEARALFTSARTESPSWPIREAPVAAAPARNPELAPRPNILWITCEDMGPHLGCYGSPDAVTPGLDSFAARSLRYLNVWSNAPVCAPARTAIISGLYPTSTGSEHMRSLVRLPDGFRMFPQLLRDAGYYCANNAKEDYNLEKPGQVWDDSSRRAHWRNRKPGQPFFAVFNLEITHESKIRSRPHTPVHDPAKVRLPAYHPDVPEVRRDWAQYHDNVAAMDAQAGKIIDDLEEDGLAGDTIVFFFGDHGSGMPRSKRSACDSGLRVPLLVHVPDRFLGLAPKDYAAGGTTSRLVSFVDLAPAVLSLAGVKPPAWLQGRAFLGPHEAPPARFLFGFRGRMDERIDLVRCVTDGRFVYVRNYLPHRIAGQHVEYMFETPTTRSWKALYDQ